MQATTVKILPGMTMLDAALASAGSLEDVFALALLNGLPLTTDLTPGTTLQQTGLAYLPAVKPIAKDLGVKPVQVMSGQTLADMAMQQMGSLEGLFALAQLNALSVTDDVAAGQQLNYSSTPVNKNIAAVFAAKGYKPASGGSATDSDQPEGIGYWIIDNTFKVS